MPLVIAATASSCLYQDMPQLPLSAAAAAAVLTLHQPPSNALHAAPSTPTGCAGSRSPHAAQCPAPGQQQAAHMRGVFRQGLPVEAGL